MTTIQVGCDLTYSVTNPTNFLLNIAAARTEHQSLSQESLNLSPSIYFESSTMGRSDIQIYRFYVEPCDLQIKYRATVNLYPEIYDVHNINETLYSQLPNEVLPYLNPSRYCESDRLTHFALKLFGNTLPGFSRITAICDWINCNLDYQAGSTGATTSACDVLIQRTGVCRDYAHVAIALCRALCIPARYISGYAVALQPPDFHGFFEAYLGSRWYLFDATRMAPVEGFVRIGTGRDAADASFATIIGSAELTQIAVWADQLEPSPMPSTSSAVSTNN